MNASIETQRVIKLHFLPCDFSDAWSRLTHYGLSVTNRGNQLVHVLLEVGNDGYELLIDDGISNYDVTPATTRLLRMKASATITLTPKLEASFFIVQGTVESMVEEGRSLDLHGLIDWIYGDDDYTYLCTDFIREALEIANPQTFYKPVSIKTPVEMFRWMSQKKELNIGSGIYMVDTWVSSKLEF